MYGRYVLHSPRKEYASWVIKNRRRYAVLAFALCASLSAHAGTLLGRVVGITDGDTVTVLDAGNVQHTIRLSGIDAPEKNRRLGTPHANIWRGSCSENRC